ncbi:MAG: LytTR family DNA-binding domain-containing protein [Thermomonas sp.]
MSYILRLSLLLTLCLSLLPVASAAAPSMQWIDVDSVTTCPAQDGHTTPPDFLAPGCQKTSFWAIDPQHASLWLKSNINVTPVLLDQSAPLGLFVSGKFASTAWLNGRRIGGNGKPGVDASRETPGRMDAVIPIPRDVLHIGANEIVLRVSGYSGFLRLGTPMQAFAIGTYADPTDMALRAYWPSLITFGIFLLGMLYFAVVSLRGNDRKGSLLLCLISMFAAGQLLAEVSRGLYPYRYPFHDVRLILIVLCSLGFGLCLTAHVIRRFRPPHPLLSFSTVALVTVGTVVLVNPYDGKALLAMLCPVLFCALGTAYWWWKRKPEAAPYCLALILFSVLTFVLGGQFLDVVFFFLVAALLLFLFIQQAAALTREQQQHIAMASRARQLEAALDQARTRKQPESQVQTVKVIDTGRIELVSTDEITHCSGAGDYVELYIADGSKRLHTGSLNEMEAELPSGFLRVHRSHIVNTAFVESLKRESSGVGQLRMSTGEVVPVSRRIMPTVRRTIGSI